jgi:hypothetical protein
MSAKNESASPANDATAPDQGEARIHCPKCKAANPTSLERCEQCGQSLLPGQSAGLGLFFLFFFLVLAGVFASLMYWNFIREGAPNPESFWLNPVSLGVGILLSLILAFVLPSRRTPMYKRYENRSHQHLGLNLRQSIADLSSALELAPDKARSDLLKQRRRLYEKIGDRVNADRDRLTLALDPDAWKSEGDFLTVFGGMQGDAFSWSMRRAAIDNLVSSGVAVAVGYCKQCNKVVELNKEKKCPVHPVIKGREVELVIPADVAAGKLVVLSKLMRKVPALALEINRLLEANEAVALAYCPRCQGIMQLDSLQRCPHHPNVRLKGIAYSLPDNVEAQKRQMMRELRLKKSIGNRYLVALVITLLALAAVYFLVVK